MSDPEPCPTPPTPGCAQDGDGGNPWAPPLPSAEDVGSGALDGIADAMREGLRWFLENTMTWWVKLDSPDLQQEQAIGHLHQYTLPITTAVAVLGVLAAAGKVALTHKANPLIDVGSGLALIAVTGAIGVVLPDHLLRFGDTWSDWVIRSAAGADFEKRMPTLLGLDALPAALAIVLGLVAMIVAALQAILMMFRQGAIVILAGVLPLAAAGTVTGATRPWFRKVTGWMLALIFYKPAAAAVYATMFTLVGTGNDLRAILMGFAMMIVSLVAFPVLLAFFTWTTGAAEARTGGAFMGALIGGATAVGALRGPFGGSASDHASFMNEQLRPQTDPAPHQQNELPTTTDPATGDDQPHDPGPGQSHPLDAQHSPTPQPTNEADEPVGPTVWRTARNEPWRGRDTLRWLNQPTGPAGAGEPAEGGTASGE